MSRLASVIVRRGLPALGLGILWAVGERIGVALFDSAKKKKSANERGDRETT